MLCEMCGKDVPYANSVTVEGANLKLCPDCSKFGVTVSGSGSPHDLPGTVAPEEVSDRLAVRQKRREERDMYAELPPMELDPDWPKKIRAAREARGLSLEAFGSLLNEKSSVVHKLESGGIVPPDALVRKIERVLKIRLRAPPGQAS